MKRLKNVRQEKFCQAVCQSKTQVEAYQEAYPDASYETAKANASELTSQDKIADRITYILNTRGLTLTSLVDNQLKELLRGKKEVIYKDKVTEIQDNTALAEGLKIALKLHKVLDNKEIYEDNRQVNITLDQAQIDKLEAIVNIIKELSSKQVISGEIT